MGLGYSLLADLTNNRTNLWYKLILLFVVLLVYTKYEYTNYEYTNYEYTNYEYTNIVFFWGIVFSMKLFATSLKAFSFVNIPFCRMLENAKQFKGHLNWLIQKLKTQRSFTQLQSISNVKAVLNWILLSLWLCEITSLVSVVCLDCWDFFCSLKDGLFIIVLVCYMYWYKHVKLITFSDYR